MQQSAAIKQARPNAVCHGTASEMITDGGEVAFVKRIIDESVRQENRKRIL